VASQLSQLSCFSHWLQWPTDGRYLFWRWLLFHLCSTWSDSAMRWHCYDCSADGDDDDRYMMMGRGDHCYSVILFPNMPVFWWLPFCYYSLQWWKAVFDVWVLLEVEFLLSVLEKFWWVMEVLMPLQWLPFQYIDQWVGIIPGERLLADTDWCCDDYGGILLTTYYRLTLLGISLEGGGKRPRVTVSVLEEYDTFIIVTLLMMPLPFFYWWYGILMCSAVVTVRCIALLMESVVGGGDLRWAGYVEVMTLLHSGSTFRLNVFSWQ